MNKVVVNIAILGVPSSGKRSLKAKLDQYVVYRNGNMFMFQSHINVNTPNDLDISFAVALMTTDDQGFMSHPSESLIRARALVSGSRICVGGTMRDTMLPDDYSDRNIAALAHPTCIPYFHDTAYFPVTCLNGHGIDALCEYIVDVVTESSRPRKITLSSRFDQLARYLLDGFASIFALPVPKDVNRDTPDCMDLDDETVSQMVKSPVAETWRESLKARCEIDADASEMPTHRITPALIVKNYNSQEKAAIEYVRLHTRIPVPQLHNRHLGWWLVSDFIEGEMLSECWGKQSIFMKFRIACTIRTYLAQLRRLKGTIPGSLFNHTANGPFFDDTRQGPFQSVLHFQRRYEMIAYFGWRMWVECCQRNNELDSLKLDPRPVPPGELWELVFAHGDLNDTNMILARDGTLWIIDWAESGFYPTWFDGAAMARYDNRSGSWQLMRLFAVGTHADAMFKHFWEFVLTYIHRAPYK